VLAGCRRLAGAHCYDSRMSASTPVVIWSTFGWPEAVSLIISGLSAVGVIALGYWQLWRSRRPLVLDVREIEGLTEYQGEWLVALRLAFVNPSSSGRTVYQFAFDPDRAQARVRELDPVPVKDGRVRFDLHDDADKAEGYDPATVLQLPLDVPPFESRTRMWIVGLRPCDDTRVRKDPDRWNVRVALVVQDTQLNDLARYERVLPIEKQHHIVAAVEVGDGG